MSLPLPLSFLVRSDYTMIKTMVRIDTMMRILIAQATTGVTMECMHVFTNRGKAIMTMRLGSIRTKGGEMHDHLQCTTAQHRGAPVAVL